MAFAATAYAHLGIRVTDKDRAIEFYEKLGWSEEIDLPEHSANEMVNAHGIYINLIFNGVPREDSGNILQDEPIKYPGITHAAFVIDSMKELLALLGCDIDRDFSTDRVRLFFAAHRARSLGGPTVEVHDLFAGE